MKAIEYLKLATDNTEAGDLIKNNNLTEAIVKMLDNYAEIKIKDQKSGGVVPFSKKEVNSLTRRKYNSDDWMWK
jgi:hypothetical protein